MRLLKLISFQIIIFLMAGLLTACSVQKPVNTNPSFIVVGDKSADAKWIYLSGLTDDIHSIQEKKNRAILNRIGKKQKIAFIAVIPKHRCSQLYNKLCWPHETKWETIKTFNEIQSSISRQPVNGYIGFSNGGFFLNRLVQFKALQVPVMTIGSGAYLENMSFSNTNYLLIGTNDTYHYQLAKRMFLQAVRSPLKIKVIEFDGGHEMREEIVEDTILKISHH